MNNKGFTLVEILAVIAILGVLAVMITINFGSSLRKTNQKICDSFVNELETAACTYAALSNKKLPCNRNMGSCIIPVRYLYEEGMLKGEKDDCTGNDIDLTATVTVTWNQSGEKICNYNGVRVYGR